jgi:hypothetical protein
MTAISIGWLAAQVALAGPVASSEGVGTDGTRHTAARAFDGLFSTGWAEGDMGDGEGAWLELRFDRPIDLGSISIFPGWLAGMNREIKEYGRPKLLTVTVQTAKEPFVKQERLLDVGYEGPMRHDVLLDVAGARSVRITLDDVYTGGLYSDTFIAEVAINLLAGPVPSSVTDLKTWMTSDAGLKAGESQRTKAIAKFDAITGADFGDRDALRDLMAWASDGAPYLRERASRVPAGFRLSAVEPDKTSVEALLKLKDSNAIPAIERASLRTTGKMSEDLRRRARLFDAYQEVLGGGGRNVVPWGQTGIGKGELKGLEEPLDVAVDEFGGVYIADLGNNRVVRFSATNGVVEQMWGNAVPGVAEAWFGRKRDGYASGASPGTELGQFTNPVDLALVPDRGSQGVLVLDASARVTYIDPGGKFAWAKDLPAQGKLSPGVGGSGHVLYTGGKVVVLYGDEGFVYSFGNWTELHRFELKEGAPSSAVAFKDGQLGLVYQDKLILYSQDGFRLGDILGDSLGEGYQDWAVTVDEKGKLWAILDTGELVKFKKPGKVAFRVPLAKYSLPAPRISVFDDLVYVTSKDKILHADALELLEGQNSGDKASGLLEVAPTEDE